MNIGELVVVVVALLGVLAVLAWGWIVILGPLADGLMRLVADDVARVRHVLCRTHLVQRAVRAIRFSSG